MFDRNLIMDVGVHDGTDTEFYLDKGFKVVGIEANPKSCERLRQRFADAISAGRFVLVEKAIANSPGEITLFSNTKDSGSGTTIQDYVEFSKHRGGEIETYLVPTIAFASILETYGVPYFLKIDIEGADNLCLEGLLAVRDRPRYLSVERLRSFSRQRKQLNLLKELGYSRFQMVDQSSIKDQTPPDPALEGSFAARTFQNGHCSGLFGKELPGHWGSYSDLWASNANILFRQGLIGRIPGLNRFIYRDSWYDIHATLAG